MNAVEIEEAVTELVKNPYDAAEFPYQFLGWPVVVVLPLEEYQRLKNNKEKNLTKSNTARPTRIEEN
jgi:hypothetical protein